MSTSTKIINQRQARKKSPLLAASRQSFFNRTTVLLTVLVFLVATILWILDHSLMGTTPVKPLRITIARYMISVPIFAVVTYLGCTVYFLQKEAHERSIAETEVGQFLVLGRLAASIAHEVRNPLNNIKLLLEEIESGNQDPLTSQLLLRLDGNVGRINHAVELVYRLARPGEVRQRLEGNDYTEILQLIEEVRTTLPLRDAERLVSINKTRRDNVYTNGDHGSLQTIIENLVRNACLASKSNPVYIDLDTDSERNLAIISIYNEGSLPTDFNFGEIDDEVATTRQVRGLGLGVLIIRQLAKQMNINLSYKSDDSVVTFTAKIPLHLGLFNRRDTTEADPYVDDNPARIDCR